ncbi:hypothetical protein [Sphingopyxis sp. H115]|uniref:hypothetical protein n=1 Tax=Sphingopyxis sp. H115 TaxID=1759073 RepID=UPI000736C832|nr:hypothetical protein [Sphingopyxis sp. H115]KTE10753.1 hypothetical protein ATE71_12155 [Sphingopyxis sp. H115]
MAMRKLHSMLLLSLAATMAVSTSAAPRPDAPDKATPAKPRPKFDPPGVICQGDPAISRINLIKGAAPGSVTVTVETRNQGTGAWRSRAGQQVLAVMVRNGNTGAVSRHSWPLHARAEAGTSMGTYGTPLIRDAFDTFEFRGTVEAKISYDPDILIDGNSCNDDRNMANNVRRVSDSEVGRFLAGDAARMQF